MRPAFLGGHFAQQQAIRRLEPAANARLFERPVAFDETGVVNGVERFWRVELYDPTVPHARHFGLPPSVVLRASREIGMIVARRELARLAASRRVPQAA
jgi:hypothetical protein